MVDRSRELHICSYNIHKGVSLGNTRYILDKMREAIVAVDADIMFLQEVVGENTKATKSRDAWDPHTQFEYLADSSWPHHAYGRNSVYSHGHHGNAILSRYELDEARNIDLSILPYSYRGVLATKSRMPCLQLLCLHLGLLGFERRKQAKKLIDHITNFIEPEVPLIVAGDFNDWQNRLGMQLENELKLTEAIKESYGKSQPTYPAKSPLFPLDRIYYRGLELIECQVLSGKPWSSLSDHCAVYARFIKPGS